MQLEPAPRHLWIDEVRQVMRVLQQLKQIRIGRQRPSGIDHRLLRARGVLAVHQQVDVTHRSGTESRVEHRPDCRALEEQERDPPLGEQLRGVLSPLCEPLKSEVADHRGPSERIGGHLWQHRLGAPELSPQVRRRHLALGDREDARPVGHRAGDRGDLRRSAGGIRRAKDEPGFWGEHRVRAASRKSRG